MAPVIQVAAVEIDLFRCNEHLIIRERLEFPKTFAHVQGRGLFIFQDGPLEMDRHIDAQ
jgi:hypothetical protein